jgi:hypothetical protein
VSTELHRFPLEEEKNGRENTATQKQDIKSKSIECVSDRGADTVSRQIDPASLWSSGRAPFKPPGRLSHQAKMQHFHPLRLIPADLSLLLSVPFEMRLPLRKHLVPVPVATSVGVDPPPEWISGNFPLGHPAVGGNWLDGLFFFFHRLSWEKMAQWLESGNCAEGGGLGLVFHVAISFELIGGGDYWDLRRQSLRHLVSKSAIYQPTERWPMAGRSLERTKGWAVRPLAFDGTRRWADGAFRPVRKGRKKRELTGGDEQDDQEKIEASDGLWDTVWH